MAAWTHDPPKNNRKTDKQILRAMQSLDRGRAKSGGQVTNSGYVANARNI
jgi:hypothetical protein